MTPIKRIDINEFVERGYLQEVNRRFLHPLGLALEVVIEEDGSAHLGGVWDYREDFEGICFAGGYADLAPKAETVEAEWQARVSFREKALGYIVQPIVPVEDVVSDEKRHEETTE